MKLSIVTVCYNAEQCIDRTIKSVLNQTCPVCLGYSFVLVIEHILGIIPGTSEMFPTYVLLALVPFSLYEMDMEHGIKFNVIYLICTFLIMLMTSKRSYLNKKEYLEIIVLEKKPFLKLELIIILAIFMKIWIC